MVECIGLEVLAQASVIRLLTRRVFGFIHLYVNTNVLNDEGSIIASMHVMTSLPHYTHTPHTVEEPQEPSAALLGYLRSSVPRGEGRRKVASWL